MPENLNPSLLQNLLTYSTEAIVFSNLEGIVQFTNPAADRLYGYDRGELIGQHVDVFNARETIGTEEIVESITNTGRWQGVLVQRRKDGSVFDSALSVALIFDESGNPAGFGSHSRNVSEELRAEKELRESGEKYRKLFDTTRDGILIHIDGKIKEINNRFSVITGYSHDELLALQDPVKEIVDPADVEMVQKNMAAMVETPYTVRAHSKDGRALWLSVIGTSTVYEGQQARVVSIDDMTAIRKNEKLLTAALKEKEVLLGEIYHRTKNNMQVISSLLSLRAMNSDDNGALQRSLQEVIDKIQSMSLVHQKLYESKNLSSLSLDQYIRDLSALIEQNYSTGERKISMVYELEPVSVLIEPAIACGLILSELLSNCYKHAFADRAAGQIKIELSRPQQDMLALAVSDDGVGTRKDARTASSLGMATVIGIVEHQLSGSIDFKNDHGFRVEITFRENLHRSRI